MNIRWLRSIDGLAKIIPTSLLRFGNNYSTEYPTAVIRPGGLGDLVVLTRAAIELEVDITKLFWLVEKRNKPWLDYLGISSCCYDSFDGIKTILCGTKQFRTIINTEQYHGLAAVVGARLAGSSGKIIGLSGNPRSDLHNTNISHRPDKQHELETFKEILTSISLPKGTTALPKANSTKTDTPFTVVALGGLQEQKKRLDHKDWLDLIGLARNYTNEVYLVGSPLDATFAKTLEQECSFSINNCIGEFTFSQTVDLIRTASRLISVDSGLVHIADFFSIPTDVLFRKEAVTQWQPLDPQSNILLEVPRTTTPQQLAASR